MFMFADSRIMILVDGFWDFGPRI